MIKKSYVFILTCYLTTASLTHAMDKPVIDQKELPRLAVNLNAPTITFLGNTHLMAILASQKPSLINITTGKDKLLSHKEDSWGIKTNSDKTKAIIWGTNTLLIYDSQTNTTYTNDNIRFTGISPVHFTDIPDIIAIEDSPSSIMFYNYITKEFTEEYSPFQNVLKGLTYFNRPSLTIFLHQKKLMFSDANNLYIYSKVNDNPQELHVRTITLSRELTIRYRYNQKKSLVAFNDCATPVTVNVLNIETGKKILSLDAADTVQGFLPMLAPHESIFTTVSNNSIDYRYTQTGKCIARQPRTLSNNFFENYFSFSADGTLLAVAAGEKLEILEVPFETIGPCAYPLKTKDKMITLLCLLKNLQQSNEYYLSADITRLITQNILTTSELTGN